MDPREQAIGNAIGSAGMDRGATAAGIAGKLATEAGNNTPTAQAEQVLNSPGSPEGRAVGATSAMAPSEAPQEINSLVAGMETPKPQDIGKPGKKEPNYAMYPTLANYRGANANPQAATVYPEEKVLRHAVDSSSMVKDKMSKLGTMTGQDRAITGAYHGGDVGMQTNGAHGGVLGAAIGAYAGRAAGMIQSGELEDSQRKSKVQDSLRYSGVANDKGQIKFDDGHDFDLAKTSLENTSSIMGKPNRSLYEVDKTNPFTGRTTAVARPLAYHIAKGMLKYNDPKNPADQKTLDNTTNMLVNALQSGADDVGTVYNRAKQLANKFGVTRKSMESLLAANAKNMDDSEALRLKRGMDVLYAGMETKK